MRRSRTQTSQHILDAAYGLFWRQGFLRVSMDDIAARADITKRTLYQHFRSKDDLIAAALAHSSELAIERLGRFRRSTRCDELIDFSSPSLRSGRPNRDGRAAASRVLSWSLPIYAVTPPALSHANTRRQWKSGLRTHSPPLGFHRHAIEHARSCCSWRARWYLCSSTGIATTPKQLRERQNHLFARIELRPSLSRALPPRTIGRLRAGAGPCSAMQAVRLSRQRSAPAKPFCRRRRDR